MGLAGTLFEPEPGTDDEFVERVIAAQGARRRLAARRAMVSAAAALVLVVGVGAGAVGAFRLSHGGVDHENRFAQVADTWQAADSVRFVYQATATVAPPLDPPRGDHESLLTPLPTCRTDNSPASEPPGPAAGEVNDLIDALLGTDPCAALADIRQHVGGTTKQIADNLYRTRTRAEADAAQIASIAASSPLEQHSLTLLYNTIIKERDVADGRLALLRTTTSRTATTLQSVADAADYALPIKPFQVEATEDLHALVALVDDTTAAAGAKRSVTWQQLATGIWRPSSITVAGTTDAPDGNTTTFTAAVSDDLDLVSTVLAAPEQIPQILRSAPNSSAASTTWRLPATILIYPGITTWNATARLDGERLDRLTLHGTGPRGITVTITITTER